MFNTRRLVVLVVLGVFAYGFWPREPNLLGYRPKELSALETESWKQSKGKQWFALTKTQYEIFRDQYGFSPYRSLSLALGMSRALSLYRGSADVTDREEAIKPLRSVLEVIKKDTKATFDATALAEKQVKIWALSAEEGSAEATVQSQAEMLAAIYGGSAKKYMVPARSFVSAIKTAQASDWARTNQSLQQAWTDLKNAAHAK